MALAVIFLLIPVVIYAALVAVPLGGQWRIVLGLVIAVLCYIWLGYLFAWQPLWTGTPRADVYMLAAANFYSFAAIVGALTATYGRGLARRYDALSYPLVVIGILLVTFVPLIFLFGV